MGRPRRRPVLVVAVLVLGAVALGCTADDTSEAPETTGPVATSAEPTLCVRFPLRDAGALFAVPDDPALAGDPAVADKLLDMGAAGLVEAAPGEIRPAVEVYAAALRDHDRGEDPLADPSIGAAVDDLDAWLAQHCPPPPATSPPATSPP